MGNDKLPTTSPHHHGLLEILRLRLYRGPDESISVTQGAFINLLLQNLGPMSELPGSPPEFTMFPRSIPSAPDNIPCKLLGLTYKAVSLCRAFPSVIADQRNFGLYFNKLRSLNKSLASWENTVPDSWKYTIQSKPAAQLGEQQNFLKTTFDFPLINSMMLWSTFWMTRLDVLLCLDKLYADDAPERLLVRSDMSLIVDQVCSAIPYMTGQVVEIGKQLSQGATKNLGSLFAMRSVLVASPGSPIAC